MKVIFQIIVFAALLVLIVGAGVQARNAEAPNKLAPHTQVRPAPPPCE